MSTYHRDDDDDDQSDSCEFECGVVHSTERTWLVAIDGVEYWLPKSRCRLEENSDGETATVFVPEWRAIEKGLV